MEFFDLRQSDEWSEYLEGYGWKSERLSNGSVIRFMKLPFTGVAKIQRPGKLDKDNLAEIDSLCKRKKTFMVKLEPALSQDLSLLKDAGYSENMAPSIPPKTRVISLVKNEGGLWNDLSQSAKYSIKRAEREGVCIKVVRNPKEEDLAGFFGLLKEAGNRKGFYVQSFSDLKRKVKAFKENSFLLSGVNKNGETSCSKLFLSFGKCVWYVHGATTKIGQKDKAGYELAWRSILHFKNLGFELLDWEGIYDERFAAFTKKWKNFTEFKRKFGGFELEFPTPFMKYYFAPLKLLSMAKIHM